MVEGKSLFHEKIDWIQCAIRGALYLSKEALIESQFRDEMQSKLSTVYDKIKTFYEITDAKQQDDLFPILDEEQKTVEDIRKVFYNVIKTHKPEKFQARLTEGRDQSHNLKVQFCVADCVTNMIQQNLISFFQDKIIEKLKNQFDLLCDEMIRAISVDEIQVEGATQRLLEVICQLIVSYR